MATIISLIPDVEVLVSLAPEELAETVLKLAFEHRQNNLINIEYITSAINGTPGANDGYPQNRRGDAELALAEAWNWLLVQGLLIPVPGINGRNGWMLLSRRARQLLASGTFRTYVRSMAFPKSLLHPSIADDVWLDIIRGDIETAVFKAFRAVEIAVREVGGFSDTDIGTTLMRKAFDKLDRFQISSNQKLNARHCHIYSLEQLVLTRILILIVPLQFMIRRKLKKWLSWQVIYCVSLIAEDRGKETDLFSDN